MCESFCKFDTRDTKAHTGKWIRDHTDEVFTGNLPTTKDSREQKKKASKQASTQAREQKKHASKNSAVGKELNFSFREYLAGQFENGDLFDNVRDAL